MKKIGLWACALLLCGCIAAQTPVPVVSWCGQIVGGAGRCYTNCDPNQVATLYRGHINIVNCSEVYDTLNNIHYYLDKSDSLGKRWKRVVNGLTLSSFKLQVLEYQDNPLFGGEPVTISDTTDFVKLKPPQGWIGTSFTTQRVNLPVTQKAHIQVLVYAFSDGLAGLIFVAPQGHSILVGASWSNLQNYDLLDLYYLPTGEWIIKKR